MSALSHRQNKTLVLLGSGPGIGVATSSHFASHGFNTIILLSRTASRLRDDAKSVRAAAPKCTISTFDVDVTDGVALRRVLAQIEMEFGPPEVVVYNASRLKRSPFEEYKEEEVLEDLRAANMGLWTAARWAMPHLVALAKEEEEGGGGGGVRPCFLVTSGGLAHTPMPILFSLSMAKAAQRSLTRSLGMEYGDKGVHVGSVVVHGIVKREDGYWCHPDEVAKVSVG